MPFPRVVSTNWVDNITLWVAHTSRILRCMRPLTIAHLAKSGQVCATQGKGATTLFPQPLKPCPDTPTTTDGQIFVAALNWAPRRMSSLFFVHSSPAVRSGATIHSKTSSHARHVSPDRLADCHPGSECRFDPRLCPRHVPHLLEMRHPERSPKDVLPALRPGTAHSLSLPPHISRSQPVPRELLSY